MFIYEIYQSWVSVSRFNGINELGNLLIGLIAGGVFWLAFFVLQGIGLYTMAKNRKLKNKWLAFVPFANVFFMGKLVGECTFFGRKVKRLGLYAMITQILASLVAFASIFAEIYLFAVEGRPIIQQGFVYWANLVGTSETINRLYGISGFILLSVDLIYMVTSLLLYSALYKKYSPDNNFMLLLFSLFLRPFAQYVIVFILRKREAVDYEAYMRKRQEEFLRQQQAYRNMYGNPGGPYGRYTWGAPNQNPYSQPTHQPQEKPEEPFEEFASNTSSNGEKTSSNGDDEFFN